MLRGKKGKAPTKGAKQILGENAATVSFYRNMALACGSTYSVATLTFFPDNLSPLILFLNAFVLVIYAICYHTMLFMSQPNYKEGTLLLTPGIDLNMEGGMGEHVKDVVILCSITHLLAVFFTYAWLLLLFLPIRACWLLWVNFLGPWFFQPAPVEPEVDEKKKRKMERKMNQMYYQ